MLFTNTSLAMIDPQAGMLGYTILAGLVGVAFFLGRVSSRVDRCERDSTTLTSTTTAIFTELRELTKLAAKNEGYHQQQLHNQENGSALRRNDL